MFFFVIQSKNRDYAKLSLYWLKTLPSLVFSRLCFSIYFFLKINLCIVPWVWKRRRCGWRCSLWWWRWFNISIQGRTAGWRFGRRWMSWNGLWTIWHFDFTYFFVNFHELVYSPYSHNMSLITTTKNSINSQICDRSRFSSIEIYFLSQQTVSLLFSHGQFVERNWNVKIVIVLFIIHSTFACFDCLMISICMAFRGLIKRCSL